MGPSAEPSKEAGSEEAFLAPLLESGAEKEGPVWRLHGLWRDSSGVFAGRDLPWTQDAPAAGRRAQGEIEMNRFQKLVKTLAEQFEMPEDVVAEVCLNLFRDKTFDWRKL